MSERLREHLLRGRVSPLQARAGTAWHGDWIEAGRQLAHARMDRRCAEKGEGDVMHVAARERLRRVEAAFGGRDTPWYKVAHHIVLLDREAKEVADLVEIDPRSTMTVLRLALDELAKVYRLRESVDRVYTRGV